MADKVRSEMNHLRPKVDFSKSFSRTRQEFKDEANINNLLKRYSLTGQFYDPLVTAKASRQPMFGDFTKFGDFQTCQNLVIEARERFDALPVEVRKKFNYDPAALLEWLRHEENREEAIKLGLIEKVASADATKTASADATKTASDADATKTASDKAVTQE